MSTFPILGKPDVNLLEEYVFGKPKAEKRAERLVRSQKARERRSEIKQINNRKAVLGRSKKA